jgi:Zn-dependent protease
VVYALSHRPIWAALASVGALINLFNLLPIWQLDGGRAFRSLTRPHRWLAVAAIATAWAVIPDERLNMLLLALMVVGAVRTTVEKPADESDPRILIQICRPPRCPLGPVPPARSHSRSRMTTRFARSGS